MSDRLEKLRQAVFDAVRLYAGEAFVAREFEPGQRIPYAARVFDEREILSLVDASLEFWLTAGRFSERFESGLASALGVQHASLVNSGSSANLCAFMALTSPSLGARRIERGDEVITVAAAFPTTVAPIVQYGAVPVFVDVTLPSYNIDLDAMEAALGPRTKAVMLAHTLGNPFDLERVNRFCRDNGLWLIEDNCDSLGAEALVDGQWQKTGAVGHLGTSSFYPPHHITTGEGGAVVTNDPDLKRLVVSMRDWGRDCWCGAGTDGACGTRFNGRFGQLPEGFDHKYVFSHFGYNLRATDLQAAIGCVQLERLEGFIEARRANWQFLRDALSGAGDRFILPEPSPGTRPSWFGFLLTVKPREGFSRNGLATFLEGRNIQTRTLFAGNLIKHPCFDGIRDDASAYRVVGGLENTDRIMNDSLWVGVYPGLTRPMLEYMAQSILEYGGGGDGV